MIRVGPDRVDEVTGAVWIDGVIGIEERIVDADLVELRVGTSRTHLDEVLAVVPAVDVIDVVEVAHDEGLDDWRRYARPWRAGRRTVVVPTWVDDPEWIGSDDLVLRLDPGRAFGSGSHGTTRMCLAEIEDLVVPGSWVADIGCGSGVLAVAAARAGAGRVLAVDPDPEARRVTVSNASLNGVTEVVNVDDLDGDGRPLVDGFVGRCDLVVANIGAATLRALRDDLLALRAPNGVVVLSGILGSQIDQVRQSYSTGGAIVRTTVIDGEWCTLVLD